MKKMKGKSLQLIVIMLAATCTGAMDPNLTPVAKIASYSASIRSAVHLDTEPPSVLTDGQWANATKQSVEYKGDVVITARLESATWISEAVAYFYMPSKSMLESIGVEISLNGTDWEQVAVQPVTFTVQSAANMRAYELAVPVKREAAYIRFSFKRADGSARVLLGEIAVR